MSLVQKIRRHHRATAAGRDFRRTLAHAPTPASRDELQLLVQTARR